MSKEKLVDKIVNEGCKFKNKIFSKVKPLNDKEQSELFSHFAFDLENHDYNPSEYFQRINHYYNQMEKFFPHESNFAKLKNSLILTKDSYNQRKNYLGDDI